MNINVQSPLSALTALDSLAIGAGPAGAAQATAQVQTASNPDQTSPVLDVNAVAGVQADDPQSDLGDAVSIADAATSAGAAITDLLSQMRQAALAASDPGLDATSRSALDGAYQSDVAGLSSVVGQASADGANLIDGSLSGAVQVPPGAATTATLTAANLTPDGPMLNLAGSNLLDPASAASAADALERALGAVGQAVGQIATQGQAIQNHLDVLGQAALAGVSGAVAPNLDADGARLQALQVQQQLAAGGQSVASASPQSILALFR